mgnify:FL=1
MQDKYQQGDVVLVRLTESEELELQKNRIGLKPKDNVQSYFKQDKEKAFERSQNTSKNEKCILALGEHTGHHHRFEKSKMDGYIAKSLYSTKDVKFDPSYLIITYDTDNSMSKRQPNIIGPKLYHEEHNPLVVPIGTYKKTIVREFDHLTLDTRRVVD